MATLTSWPETYISYRAPVRSPLTWQRSKAGKGKVIFTVCDPETGIFGSGRDPYEAIRDLTRAQNEHREVLRGQDKLSPALKRRLKQLQRRQRRC